jgi:feruloyl esterase
MDATIDTRTGLEGKQYCIGFTIALPDSGHKGSVFDGSFMSDQQAALDFAYVAIGSVTQVAKAVVAQY